MQNTFHTYFGGRVKIPAIMLEASIHQNVIQNYTFIDNKLAEPTDWNR